jgi:putative transposase
LGPRIGPDKVLQDYPESEFRVAEIRFAKLKEVRDGGCTKEKILKASTSLKISVSQVYRLLKKFDADAGPIALLRERKGRPRGSKFLSSKVESIISDAINTDFVGLRSTFSQVIERVKYACKAANYKPPTDQTIISRVKEQGNTYLLIKKCGKKVARQETEVRGGKLLTRQPLQLIQIDHCLVDVIIVDSENFQPIGRPWMTLAIDVHTRVILGFYLSLAHPSGMSVALCLAHSILPKESWLKQIDASAVEYPFYGTPNRIHVDNAKEFKSKFLLSGCKIYGIELTWRPVKVPHNGAHIERLIGTFMRKVHGLPGTTGESIKAKGDYKSEGHAILTLSEFRGWFVREVEIYHKTTHDSIGCSPLYKWESGFRKADGSLSYPPIVSDQKRLLIDFMPYHLRTINRSGVQLNRIEYYSGALKRFERKTKCIARYDPESLKKIWVLPEGETDYIELTCSDLRIPDTSLAEYRVYRALLRIKSNERVNSDEVFELIRKKNEYIGEATSKGKKLRRVQESLKQRRDDYSHPLNVSASCSEKTQKPAYHSKPIAFEHEDL